MDTITKNIQVIGNRFRIDIYPFSTELFFESETKMRFTILEGAGLEENGYSETVTIRMMEIRPQVYLVSWKEQKGTTVSQVQDYEHGLLYTNITLPGGDFYNLQGTLKPVLQ